MKTVCGFLVVVAVSAVLGPARAGHETPIYPSYYPQEIRIEPLDSHAAARALHESRIHAYVGSEPAFTAGAGESIDFVESLGSFVVIDVNPESPMVRDGRTRCAVAKAVIASLDATVQGVSIHPYPVNGFHADYLGHHDLAEAAKTRFLEGPAAPEPKVRAEGALAETLVRDRLPGDAPLWDATVREIGLARLVAGEQFDVGGWVGPPWLKQGWFHAYLLLAGALPDAAAKQRAETYARRLRNGDHASAEERINLERDLVVLLTGGCQRVVVGYRVRREYYSAEYSGGVENIAYDSHAGFNSAIFIRTVKLKDFPWNGWLTLGIASPPSAAWNPIAGFSDEAGHLIWSAIGDPALFPEPYGAGWTLNRIGDVRKEGGSGKAAHDEAPPAATRAPRAPRATVAVPADAVLPEPGSGRLREVGSGKRARVRLTYGAFVSAFHDGTRTSFADVLYPYVIAYRWGASDAEGATPYDPEIDRATALVRERLAGIRFAGVDATSKSIRFGELAFVREMLLVEIYVAASGEDLGKAAAIAPPWSSIPWHVLALMDEAVLRGWAAFSQAEAARLGVPWLDLVRADALKARLGSLVAEFERRAYVPEPLKDHVTAEEARARWRALTAFYEEYGHFLVTGGPYLLEEWSEQATVLRVFRDPSYPLGVGSYDSYAIPRRAYISGVETQETGLKLFVEVERLEKFMRSFKIIREPLRSSKSDSLARQTLECRFVVVDADGRVALAGRGRLEADGGFALDLIGRLAPGRYGVVAALSLNGNTMNADVRRFAYTVPANP